MPKLLMALNFKDRTENRSESRTICSDIVIIVSKSNFVQTTNLLSISPGRNDFMMCRRLLHFVLLSLRLESILTGQMQVIESDKI